MRYFLISDGKLIFVGFDEWGNLRKEAILKHLLATKYVKIYRSYYHIRETVFFVDTASVNYYCRYLVLIQNTFQIPITETCSVSLFPKAPLHICCFSICLCFIRHHLLCMDHLFGLLCITEPNHGPVGNEEESLKKTVSTVSSWLWLFT